MRIAPITSQADYACAAREIERLLHARPNSAQADRLDALLARLIEYESGCGRGNLPDPVAVIQLELRQRGLSVAAIAPMIGSVTKANAVLARERPLSLPMIWRLHRGLGIPAELLLAGMPAYAGAP